MNPATLAEYSGADSSARIELSIVLPVRNLAEIIGQTHKRLKAVLVALGIRHELLFVDRGSTDGTGRILSAIAASDPCSRILFLAGGSSKESALFEGLAQTVGQATVIMDADLRDPPECIPQMLAARQAGAEVVRMRARLGTEGPLFQRIGRRCLDHILDAIGAATLPENRIDFMLFSRRAADALPLVIEREHDMVRLFDWMGLRQQTLDYTRAARTAHPARGRLRNFVRSHIILP